MSLTVVAIPTLGCKSESPQNAIESRAFEDFSSPELEGWNIHNPDAATIRLETSGLVVEPHARTLWYRNRQSVQVYRTLVGDFAMSAKVTITDLEGNAIAPSWRFGGLQLRDPGATDAVSAYHGAFGAATDRLSDVPVFESKNTGGGSSVLELRPHPSGTGEIGICRVGDVVRSGIRAQDDQPWVIADEAQRPDLPEVLAVGPIAFNGSPDANTRVVFEHVAWHSLTEDSDCFGEVATDLRPVEEDSGAPSDEEEPADDDPPTDEDPDGDDSSIDESDSNGSDDDDNDSDDDEPDTGAGEDLPPPQCIADFDGSGELEMLSDEFDDPSTLTCWTFRSEVEGLAPQWTSVDIGESAPGHLSLLPLASGWFNEFRGPLMFKTIRGDFILEARVSAKSLADASLPPSLPFNSAGIMVRDPSSTPAAENHLIWNVGAQRSAREATEGKNTVDSSSQLSLTPGPTAGRLRMCRVGSTFALARQLVGDSQFELIHTFERPDLPQTLQVGLEASGWNGHGGTPNDEVDPDLIARWDYARFSTIASLSDCLNP